MPETVDCLLCGSSNGRALISRDSPRHVVCRECGFVYQNPRPTAEEMDRYYEYGYWENRRSKETIARNGGPASYTDRSRRIVEMLQASGIGRSSNVLEIGCGTGTNLAHVCDAIGCSIAGIEPSMEESQIASSQLGVSIRCGTLSSMEATEQGKYDAVILAHVLEHLYDPFGSLAIIRR